MAVTTAQQALFEPVVDSPAPEQTEAVTAAESAPPSGPLAEIVTALLGAAELIRSLEPRLVAAATDSAVGMRDLADVVRAVNLVGRAAAGIESRAVAGFARRDEILDEAQPFEEPVEVVRSDGFVHQDAGLDVAHLLGISDGSGDTRTRRAAELTARLPKTLAAVTAGDVELWQAHAVLDETSLLDDEEVGHVDEWLHTRLATVDPTRLRQVTRYAISRVNPDAIRKRAAKTKADRRVEVMPALDQPGLSHLYALIPTHHAQAIWEAATTLAAQYQELDPGLTLEQARADAFVDLTLADVTVTAQVTLGVPVITSTTSAIGDAHENPPEPEWPEEQDWSEGSGSFNPVQPDEDYEGPGVVPNRIPDWMLTDLADPGNPLHQSCQIDGAGPMAGTFTSGVTVKAGYIPADVIAALFTHLDVTIARALIDASDGTLVETVTGAYRPTKKQRDFITLRDGTCRMYGCTRPAVSCDLDHAEPHHAGGATSPVNLAALCRHHHRAKQARHWTYTLDDTGEATWTNRRTGTVRTTAPATAMAAAEHHRRATEPVLEPEAEAAAEAPDPGPPPF